jgi:hypothetical protein
MDPMATMSSTSSPRVAIRVIPFSVETSHGWALEGQVVLFVPRTFSWAFALEHLIERLGMERLEDETNLEEQSVQTSGPPRLTTRLTGTSGVP